MQAPKQGNVAAFEVVNEPNGQLWPQRGPSTQYTIAADVNFDCGLLDPGYGHRPALDAWAGVPERWMEDDATEAA